MAKGTQVYASQRGVCRMILMVVSCVIMFWICSLFYMLNIPRNKIPPSMVVIEDFINSTEQNLVKKYNRLRHMGAKEESEDTIHIIFSTDCSEYQDWQTLVLFHSAVAVEQRGPLSRIASGCSEEKKKELTSLYKKLYPHYHIHFTPDFKKDTKTDKKYDFYNKPYGVQHWLNYASPPIREGVVVALLDPDMILLRPLTTQVRGASNNLFPKYVTEKDIFERVSKGHPVGQVYGLGAPWTDDHHRHFSRNKICDPGSPCLSTEKIFGERHFSVGPPYLVEKTDLLRIVVSTMFSISFSLFSLWL